MGKMYNQFIIGHVGWRVSDSSFFRKKHVDFIAMNSPSFWDVRQIETGGTQPLLTCMDF